MAHEAVLFLWALRCKTACPAPLLFQFKRLAMDIAKDNRMYMQIALLTSRRSYAKRLKVGCVIVKNHSIISFGWNGMPTGYDNCCEMEVDGELVTRPEVQHAELNAIAKLAENGYSSKGAAIFITHSPCIHCALLIQKCGITEVYYHKLYRSDEGLKFLRNAGVRVEALSDVEPPFLPGVDWNADDEDASRQLG